MIEALARELGGKALFPFGGPPFLPFQRWAQRAEPVHSSPIGLLIHPRLRPLAFLSRRAWLPRSARRPRAGARSRAHANPARDAGA